MIDMEIENYRDKVMGCWLGKAVGGTLGMPFEGMDGPFAFDFYHPVPTAMVPNDDLDLQVVWACLLDQQVEPEVSRNLFSTAWKNNINFPWDEYGTCIRNLREGIEPPFSGSFDNWFTNGMGAAIRSELWACLAPGNPKLAAAYACEDACLDHAGQGLWAEVWLAAMQSATFVETDIHKIVQIGFEHIPADAEIRTAIEDTYKWWDGSKDWKTVRLQILDTYGHTNFTNVTENMAFTLLALLEATESLSETKGPSFACSSSPKKRTNRGRNRNFEIWDFWVLGSEIYPIGRESKNGAYATWNFGKWMQERSRGSQPQKMGPPQYP